MDNRFFVATDPDVLAARRAEIDLSNSEWFDPATRLQDLYVPPDYFVNGSLSSDGTTLTVTYRLVDAQGNELASKTGRVRWIIFLTFMLRWQRTW